MTNIIEIYTDGGSRGNPGKSAGAFVAYVDKKEIFNNAKYFGIGTNNQAEYKAFILALNWLKNYLDSHSESRVAGEESLAIFFSDSELLVKQISGVYKIKNKTLLEHCRFILKNLNDLIISYKIIYTPREKNKTADFLVNRCLDEN